MKRLLLIAYKAAEASTHPVHKMAAVVVRGGRVVSAAHNLGRAGAHCERRALRPHADVRGATLVVVRRRGAAGRTPLCSRPCAACRDAILRAGIKKVVFFDERGRIAVEKL